MLINIRRHKLLLVSTFSSTENYKLNLPLISKKCANFISCEGKQLTRNLIVIETINSCFIVHVSDRYQISVAMILYVNHYVNIKMCFHKISWIVALKFTKINPLLVSYHHAKFVPKCIPSMYYLVKGLCLNLASTVFLFSVRLILENVPL